VKALGEKYGFDWEAELAAQGVSRRRGMMPLPFKTDSVSEDCCQGIIKNHGLYTQCEGARLKDGEYCGKCEKGASENANGEPDGGTVKRRLACDEMEYRDNKGNKVVSFAKVMKKLNLSEADVLAEASRRKVSVCEEDMRMPEKKIAKKTEKTIGEKKRGRPKKAEPTVEVDATEDLFNSLVKETSAKVLPAKVLPAKVPTVSSESGSESGSESEGGEKKTPAKAAKAAKDAEKQAAKAAKEAEKAAAKAAKEAEKEAAKAAKEAEKEAAKAEKAAAKKETKKESKKESKKEESKKEESKKEESKKEDSDDEEDEEDDEPQVKVKKFTHKGVEYLLSSENVLYDAKTQDAVGTWNPDKKEIVELGEEEYEE